MNERPTSLRLRMPSCAHKTSPIKVIHVSTVKKAPRLWQVWHLWEEQGEKRRMLQFRLLNYYQYENLKVKCKEHCIKAKGINCIAATKVVKLHSNAYILRVARKSWLWRRRVSAPVHSANSKGAGRKTKNTSNSQYIPLLNYIHWIKDDKITMYADNLLFSVHDEKQDNLRISS